MTLTITGFNVGAVAPVNQYLDLSQICCIVNRRFYRQGLNWAVAGFKFITDLPISAGSLTISKLPNTWVMANSWEKSMRAWLEMNRESLEETESVRPRFLDFKLYADADHHSVGFGANLMPLALNGGYDPGEWEPSKMVIPVGAASPGATASRELIAVGANYPGLGASGLDAVSVIEGYAASRGLPDVLDPNVPDDASSVIGFNPQNWLAATFNEGTSQTDVVIEDLITENNVAPYPFENGPDQANPGVPYADTQYPGGANQGIGLQIHDSSVVSATTIGGTTRLKGGNFPCGLIAIRQNGFAETVSVLLQIDLIPGTTRGYLAETMTEM